MATVSLGLNYLKQRCDETPWYRNGARVRLSEVHVASHVRKPKPGHALLTDAVSADGRMEARERRPANFDPSVSDIPVIWSFEETQLQERVPLDETLFNDERITVIAGEPGSGKTSILQWTAGTMASRGLDDLEKRTTDSGDIDWPILVDLDTWLSRRGQAWHARARKTALRTVSSVPLQRMS